MFRQSPIFYLAEKIDDTLTKFCEENNRLNSNDYGGGGKWKHRATLKDNTVESENLRFKTTNDSNGMVNRYVKKPNSDQGMVDKEAFNIKDGSSRCSSGKNSISDSLDGTSSDLQSLSRELDEMSLNSNGSNDRHRKRNKSNHYKKYKPNYNSRGYYPRVNASYLSSLLKYPERYITERCICNAEDACTYLKLRGTSMKECHCRSHNRFLPNNVRLKVENSIVQHILKHLMDKSVRILSLGTGAYLQDLMIILRLAEGGIKSIHIAMVDPYPCMKAYPDFKYFVEKIKTVYEMKEIIVSNYPDINEVDHEEAFDVIHAIDFDDCNSKAYLNEHRHIEVHNDAVKNSDPDKPTWDLIKTSKYLTSEEHGLIITSKGKHVLHKTPQNFPFYGTP